MPLKSLLLIFLSVALSALAQIAMKSGMSSTAVQVSIKQGSMLSSYFSMLTTPMVLVGLFSYAIGALVWLRVLSVVDVSQAYPFVALGFVITMAMGILLLGEVPHATRLLGAGLLLVGVWLIGLK